MNTLKLLFFVFFFSSTTGLYTQDDSDYLMIMLKQKEAFSSAKTEKDFMDLANTFQRISNAESQEWYPLYYAGLCYINMSFATGNKLQKDGYLDQAQYFVDAALELNPDESELYVLQALLFQGRIQIDPDQRGKKFSDKAEESLYVAKEYNPENPRLYYLLGLNTMHRPEIVGGGVINACPLFAKAAEMYNKSIPSHVLAPTWGGTQNQQLLNQNCPNK